MGWADNIKKKMNVIQHNINDKVLDSAEILGTLFVVNSPTQPDAAYSKGLFKNSWYVAVNEFDMTVGTLADPSGAASMSRIKALKSSKAFVRQDGYISFTNNLSYSYRVEYLGWPQGEGTNGWVWTGNVGPYAPVRNSVIAWKAAIKK